MYYQFGGGIIFISIYVYFMYLFDLDQGRPTPNTFKITLSSENS